MKRKDFEKIQNRSAAELRKDVAEIRERLWTTQREIAVGKVKNVRAGREIRKDIARMLTLVQQKSVKEAKKTK
jgi:ribosomal protein L29